VDAVIDLAPGAEDHALGTVFAERIRENVDRDPARAKAFRALRGNVQFVPFETGETLTLRFDHGRLTMHEGSIGVPTVTFGGPLHVLLRLPEVELQGIVPSGRGREERSSRVLRELGRRLAGGDLKIYGLISHPRTVLRILRLLARPR
jgi:hypothetical protein